MKLNKTAKSILNDLFPEKRVESLLNFFGEYVKDVYSYNELSDEMKSVMSKDTFDYFTREETLQEKVEMLFKVYEPKRFGVITNSDEVQIKSVLGISLENTNEELMEIRNKIVEYTYKNISDGTLMENSQMKMIDKMSAFTCVIDNLRFLNGSEM